MAKKQKHSQSDSQQGQDRPEASAGSVHDLVVWHSNG
jgi:hypothetical protein